MLELTVSPPLTTDDLKELLSAAPCLDGLFVRGYCNNPDCAWRWSTRAAEPYAVDPPRFFRCGNCRGRLKHYSLTTDARWRGDV